MSQRHSQHRRGTNHLSSPRQLLQLINSGRVAQLGEHLLCKQGVAGSNPVTSTIILPNFYWYQRRSIRNGSLEWYVRLVRKTPQFHPRFLPLRDIAFLRAALNFVLNARSTFAIAVLDTSETGFV